MGDSPGSSAEAVTIYCTQCGGAMRVVSAHIQSTVCCPHCGADVQPWRVVRSPSPEEAARGERGAGPPEVGQPSAPRPASPRPHPAPMDYRRQPYAGPYSSRKKVVAGVLGILLGAFGVHRFYLGYIGIGVLQICLTFCTGGYAFVWGFVEGILCLTGQMRDVDGLPLQD